MIVNVFHDTTRVCQIIIPEDIADDIDDVLGYAYRWTQNINDSWSIKNDKFHDNNDHVVNVAPLVDGYGHRSSMVGDRFEIVGGKTYVCAPIGFDEVA